MFSTLLSLLHVTSTQMLHVNANFSDLSPYLLHIQNRCEIMKSLRALFVAQNMRVNNMFQNEQCVSQKLKEVCIDFNTDTLPITNQDIFLQSPKISFSFNQCTDENIFHEKLCSPPTEGTCSNDFLLDWEAILW